MSRRVFITSQADLYTTWALLWFIISMLDDGWGSTLALFLSIFYFILSIRKSGATT